MSTQATPGWAKKFDRATLVLAAIAGIGLLFMVVTITVGVIMRYVFGNPMLGSNEIIQLTAVGVVMLALPYCTDQNGHVRVDVFDNTIGVRGRWFGDIQSRVLSAFVLSALVWRSAVKAVDAWRYADTTNMLSLPLWPFYAMIALGMALCVLVLIEQIIVLLITGRAAE
ncbi:TRAP transporter small permease [Amaricoccus sp. W119]|uniref:TRAP transporter small permease n=1 Tax=Amaricoccus sp. W119 TaxID=3391833 RepID=UPI0039A6D953